MIAAHRLQEQGCEVLAFHLLLFPEHSSFKQAREAAGILGLELNVVDFSRPFDEEVIDFFVRSYAGGITPNPCVVCNPVIKFGLLWDTARVMGAERLATGHYARLVRIDNEPTPLLARPTDRVKDQTYFLCRLTPEMLARSVFPLAGLMKSEVRSLAAGLGFEPRRESQDICFLPGGNYRDLVLSRLAPFKATPGDFVDSNGRVMGRHRGIVNYTIGQRRFLGVPGPEPYYVLALDIEKNQVVLGVRSETFIWSLTVGDIIWACKLRPDSFRAEVQIRYHHQPAAGKVTLLADNRARIDFDQAQQAVTPGQAAAVYRGDMLLGGGWIERNS